MLQSENEFLDDDVPLESFLEKLYDTTDQSQLSSSPTTNYDPDAPTNWDIPLGDMDFLPLRTLQSKRAYTTPSSSPKPSKRAKSSPPMSISIPTPKPFPSTFLSSKAILKKNVYSITPQIHTLKEEVVAIEFPVYSLY